ncbi:mediator of RNA polymerase II transcription subunit 30-like isoform X1 [Leptotrombidium deliense]|uniref:Mediator of RNA polymerase II transcription subunit 30 n=1 Tax=Leptotrombidium deliense TaxID=299467 RepID=A0A443SK47_9ACAR|nr:mediator of RNA polymerase II transcription subunit 30-like isoform X1 [Leptotrombidium deliense]
MNRAAMQQSMQYNPNTQMMGNPQMMSTVTVPQSMPPMHSQTADMSQSGGQIPNQVSMNAPMGQPQQHLSMNNPVMNPMVQIGMNSGMTNAVPPNPQPQQRELPNPILLCRFGQETVQEIVAKTSELFNFLKTMHLPNGTQVSITSQEDKKVKTQEVLKVIATLFKRLRKLYEKCNEACSGMEYIQMESLIPWREDCELNAKQLQEEKKLTENVKYLSEEHRGYIEQLRIRNRHIKELIDNLRSIVWEINTMLAMRKM